jgi:hypothetical protein
MSFSQRLNKQRVCSHSPPAHRDFHLAGTVSME